LREQAKCYFQNPAELTTGLDVINNTNLGYFQQPQRAEFFAMKGIFLSKLGLAEEANQAFSTAIQVDMNLANGWASWGQFNDDQFKEHPDDLSYAASAVNCYLNAAGIYKSSRSRKYLARVLWLLGFDNDTGVVTTSFDGYKGEMPTWYWISYIPQLLASLARSEARQAKHILIRIAKAYPQVSTTRF
jgi:transformation/transcription domain-associated protein